MIILEHRLQFLKQLYHIKMIKNAQQSQKILCAENSKSVYKSLQFLKESLIHAKYPENLYAQTSLKDLKRISHLLDFDGCLK